MPPQQPVLMPPAVTASADRRQRCRSSFCGRCFAV
jgi:hypothetical protein